MDDLSFDRLTSLLSRFVTRRATVGGLSAVILPNLVDAKRRKRRRKRKNKKKNEKIIFNLFGCVDVGNLCTSSEQCCSGICTGDAGKMTCQAHDTRGCQLADDSCLQEEAILCPDDAGRATKAVRPFCFQTTGQAAFCGFQLGNQCVACTKDADCAADFGAGAACVVCSRFCADSNHTTCIPAEI